MTARSLASLALLATLTLATTGCAQVVVGVLLATSGGGGGGGGGGSAPGPTTTATVGPGGGTFTTAQGVRIQVPPGAVATETTFTAGQGSPVVGADHTAVGVAWTLGPAGMTFSPPVTVELPWDPAQLPAGFSAGQLVVLKRNDATGQVETLVPSVGATTLTVQVSSFSTLQPAVVTAVDRDRSTVVASPATVLADGVAASTITVTVVNPANQPLPNRTVELQLASGSATVTQPGPTDSSGRATGFVRSTVAGAVTLVARVAPQGTELVQRATVTFTATPPPPPPQNPPPALTFALVSASDLAVFEVGLTGSTVGAPTRTIDLPAGTDPVGLAAQSGDLVMTIDQAATRLLTVSRVPGVPATTQALDASAQLTRRGLTRTARGRHYGVIGTSLRWLDPRNGQTFDVATLANASRVEAVAADPWGGLLACGSAGDDDASEKLYRVGLHTTTRGALTEVGAFGAGIDLDALTFASDGNLYGLRAPAGSTAELFKVDASTGAATRLGDTGVRGVRGFAEVATWLSRTDAGGPWVRHVLPDLVLTGSRAELILQGHGLGSATTIVAEQAEGAILSDRADAAGDLRVLSIEAPRTAGTLSYRLTNGVGSSRLRVRVIDGSQPLVVRPGEALHLAGTIRVASLDVQAGGTLRGVGLRPLVVFSDGAVTVAGTIDASGSIGTLPMQTGDNTANDRIYTCGDGGDGGPGGGGGGGGGSASGSWGVGVTNTTEGGVGGWGASGGGGGGASPARRSGRGGLSAGGFGGAPVVAGAGQFGKGADGGSTAGGGAGGLGGFGGGGGGTGSDAGRGGAGGPVIGQGQASPQGVGGGCGGQHTVNGSGGGGGGFGAAGTNGRDSGGNTTGGGPGGQAHGAADLVPLFGGSGGGGGSGRGAFNGLSGGGGGGGGALLVASKASITIAATGKLLANGGQAQGGGDGEGGGGSGGAVLLQAPVVSHSAGGLLEAKGGARSVPGDGHQGPGGDGRLRVDAPTLQRDGAGVSEATFAAVSVPAVGYFGTAVPVATVTTPGASSGLVTIAYSAADSDRSQVFVEVECSVDGGAFTACTPAASSPATHAVATSVGGTAHTFIWSSTAQVAAGAHTVVVRIRALDARVGAWATSAPFTVTN